jgi:hypothetical protein
MVTGNGDRKRLQVTVTEKGDRKRSQSYKSSILSILSICTILSILSILSTPQPPKGGATNIYASLWLRVPQPTIVASGLINLINLTNLQSAQSIQSFQSLQLTNWHIGTLAHFHSHSIVAGGLELISYTTLLTPFTLFIISFETFARNSYGRCDQSAVIPSVEETALKLTTFS